VGSGEQICPNEAYPPVLLIVAYGVLLVAGVIWNVLEIKECSDRGGTVIAPTKRGQHCVDR
jgi:hypothetical protein